MNTWASGIISSGFVGDWPATRAAPVTPVTVSGPTTRQDALFGGELKDEEVQDNVQNQR
jgi:hypothetical protein